MTLYNLEHAKRISLDVHCVWYFRHRDPNNLDYDIQGWKYMTGILMLRYVLTKQVVESSMKGRDT